MKIKKSKKGDIELDQLGWWILAFAVLVLMILGYFILSGKGTGILEYLKNLFRFKGA